MESQQSSVTPQPPVVNSFQDQPVADEGPTQERQPDTERSTHVIGEDCASHFANAITEESHRHRLEKFLEDGNLLEDVLVSLLKTALDSDNWHAASGYMEDARETVQVIHGKRTYHCPVCKCVFEPERMGQKFCCNACAYQSQGLTPTVLHTETCSVMQNEKAA